MILSIDFDGTIVDHAFPEIGQPLPDAFEVMSELLTAGFILVLNTCREDIGDLQYLTQAVEFCRANGIEFHAVNETPPENEFRHLGGLNRKVFAHYYIDDRNLGGFPGWAVVREMLLSQEEEDNV